MPAPEENIRKIAELIRGIQVAMLTTTCADGSLRSRPMATQEAEFDGRLWFFTRDDTAKVGEIGRDQHVNVSYADPGRHHYVSLSGRANVVRDHQKIAELWNPMLKAWFPKGMDDPDLALLEIVPDSAEYWDAPSSPLVHLVGFVKAAVTGQPYKPDVNRKVNFGTKVGAAGAIE